jgi:recombination protein U
MARAKSSHANRGRAWEQTLDLFHARYESQRLAVVIRTPPPVKILRALKPGQFVAVYAREGPPDYVVLADGVAIMAEAKHTTSERWSLSQLHEHQARRLEQWRSQGGCSVVLIRHAKSATSWAIDWRKLGPIWNRWALQRATGRRASAGTASLGVDELRRFGEQFDAGGYLDAVLSMHSTVDD